MTNSIAGAVMVGAGTGIVFVIAVVVMTDSFGTHFPNTPSDFFRVASQLDETHQFLRHYPNANSIVYLRDIVEYSFQDAKDRYAGLRISIDRNGGDPTFMQVSCFVVGDEFDAVEIHGLKLEGIDKFLQDQRCPDATFNN
jgi:hypothetical protein